MSNLIYQLTRRNIKIFLKDRAGVFFSLLAPLIVLVLYLLFLGRIQTDAVSATLEEIGFVGLDKQIKAFCDSWMLAGVMTVSCITVSLSAYMGMVQDKTRGITADRMASPVPKWTVTLSYIIANVIVTFFICLIAIAVAFVYLAASKAWFLSAGDAFAIIGIMLLSVISASSLCVLIASLFKTDNAFSGFIAITSSAIGFLVGAFMPITMFPKPIAYLTLFLPGSYSGGLFRNFFMNGALGQLPAEVADSLAKNYSMNFDFFGTTIGPSVMLYILLGITLVFVLVNVLVITIKPKAKKKPLV